MKEYCGICDQINEVNIKKVKETYNVREEQFCVNADVAFCDVCGNKVHCPALDKQTLNSAFSAYREKHNLLSPDYISKIRNKYSFGGHFLLNRKEKT